MIWGQIAVVLLVVAIVVVIEIAERVRVHRLLQRPCAGIRWHRRFPIAPHDEIRSFLKLFVAAFSFDEKKCLAFRPDDGVLDIYFARNIPHVTLDDLGELESFALALQQTYSFDLEKYWRPDITLGEIFSVTRNAPNRSFQA